MVSTVVESTLECPPSSSSPRLPDTTTSESPARSPASDRRVFATGCCSCSRISPQISVSSAQNLCSTYKFRRLITGQLSKPTAVLTRQAVINEGERRAEYHVPVRTKCSLPVVTPLLGSRVRHVERNFSSKSDPCASQSRTVELATCTSPHRPPTWST